MKFPFLSVILSFLLVVPFVSFSNVEKGKPAAQLAAAVLNSTTVKLTWIGTQKDFSYRVRYRPVGVLTWTTYNVQAPTCTRRVNDLKPGTSYQWQVQTQFSKSTRDTSSYTNGPNFKPWEPCETPQGLVTMMDGNTGAALMWLPTGDSVQYNVRMRQEGPKEWITYTTDKNVLTVSELESNKGYEWDVTAQCKASDMASEASDKTYFAASPDVLDNTPIGNYADYDGTQLLKFYANGTDIIEATLQNHLGERIGKLPVYYTASDGTVAFNVNEDLPPGIYNVAYRCGTQVESRNLMIAGE
jgi:hypothetical protein